jgi:hypothetical protein
MDNPEKLATSSTQDKTNKAKTTQYALETTTINLNILVLLYLHECLLYLGELSIILTNRLITSFITFTGRCGGYYTSMNVSFTSENYLSY